MMFFSRLPYVQGGKRLKQPLLGFETKFIYTYIQLLNFKNIIANLANDMK